jgi:isopenicillin N synthase-like dioxygenase
MISIPEIDIEPFNQGSEAVKRAIARRVADACGEIGFFTIRGHGVERGLIDRSFATARAFFDLPLDTKKRYLPPERNVFRGYEMMGSRPRKTGHGDETVTDMKETFASNRFDAVGPYYQPPPADWIYAPNIWPAEVAGFADVNTAYYQAMADLSHRLRHIFALGLGVEEDFFDRDFAHHFSSQTWVNYPAHLEPPKPRQQRLPAHTDSTVFTVICSDDGPGGLEVETREGEWISLRPGRDAFVVNLGDMMARWTNDHWVSTRHRVANPPAAAGEQGRRQSLCYFVNPNYDSLVTCVPTCTDQARPPKYPPITAHQYVVNKMLSTRA